MRNRLLLLVGSMLVALVAISSALAYVLKRGAEPPKALYVSLTGDNANPCTKAKPCLTFQGAFERVNPGQEIQVLSGQYPLQEIRGQRPLKNTVFRPAPGADVFVDGISIYAKRVEARNFKAGAVAAYPESDGTTIRNVDVGPLYIYGAQNIKVIGGDFGPSYRPGANSYVSYISYGETQDKQLVAPRNVVIDGALFHDFRRGGPEDHMECLHVAGGDGIVIRNSRFVRCDVFDIFFTQWAGPEPAKNVTLENNFFDTATLDGSYEGCCTYYSVRFSDQMVRYENVRLLYNSAKQAFVVGESPKLNVKMIGNVAPLKQYGCDAGITYAYNVWTGAKCSKTDKNAASGFVNPAGMDLHLKLRSAAVNAGSPKVFPARDIDGQKRPAGKRPDAGADERR